MNLVIDSNLVFSALLKPNSLISEYIHQSDLTLYAPGFLRSEIDKHQEKILSLTSYSATELIRLISHVFKRLIFIDEIDVSEAYITRAQELVRNIDPKDMIFVALSL